MSFWTQASPFRKRLYSIIAVFILSVLLVVIGSLVPLSEADANMISNELNQTLSEHKASDTLAQYIFLNNFSICLLMFIPLVGAALGFFILFETGIALGAIALTQGFPTSLALLSLVITPVFWLEFIAYSLAMAESIWLFRRLMQKRWRELKWTGLFIGIAAALLIVGAIVEMWIISFAG